MTCRFSDVTGQVKTEVRKISDFHAIHIDNDIDLFLVQSDTEKVVIRTENDFTDSILDKS